MSEKYTEEELSMLSEEERAGLEVKEEEGIDPAILKEVAGEGEAVVTPPVEPEVVEEIVPEPPKVEVVPEPEPPKSASVDEPYPRLPDPPAEYDFDAAELRYMRASNEGEEELALSIRKEIRAEEKKVITFENEVARIGAKKADIEKARNDAFEVDRANYVTLVNDYIKKYPFLGKNGNKDAIEEVEASTQYQVNNYGKTWTEALRIAVDKVAPRYTMAAPAIPTPTPSRPDIKTLANVPITQSNSPDNSKWAALDSISDGEAYEAALEKLTPSEREEYLTR